MTALELLDTCRVRGVELHAAGGDLRFRAPAGVVDAPLRAGLLAHKAELIALLTATCPTCHRATDEKRRCWRCGNRACEHCGRQTGSEFIALCWPCQHVFERAGRL